jgi:ParB family chromosome partitioning protein
MPSVPLRSASENLGRIQHHPADEFIAFAKLAKQGRSVAQIATAMGVSTLTVERRLALGKLAPRFITLLRDGEATLDQLKALSLSDDHKQQIAVWDSLGEHGRSAYCIKERIVRAAVSATSRFGRFVGVEAYVAAGGVMREDLFANDGECWLHDGALVQQLADEKLAEAVAEEKAAGWLWVEAKPTVAYFELDRFERERAKSRKPSAEEAMWIQTWTALHDDAREVVRALDAEWRKTPSGSSEETETARRMNDAQIDAKNIAEILSALHASLAQWSAKQLATRGVVVSVSAAGDIEYARGLMRPEDRKAIEKAKIAALKESGKPIPASLQASANASADGRVDGRTNGRADGRVKGERAAISERLMLDLSAHRTAAMQASLMDNSHVALALVVHAMAVPVFSSQSYLQTPLKLRMDLTRHSALTSRASEYDACPAAVALAVALEQWGDRVPGGEPVVIFRWLLAQDTGVLLDLLAFCAASGLDAMHGRERPGYDMSDALADALELDMADWWTPTPAKFLESVSKDQLVQAVTEAESAEIAKPMGTMKKADAVAFAAAKLEGKRWLPAPLARKAAPAQLGSEEEQENDEQREEEQKTGDGNEE